MQAATGTAGSTVGGSTVAGSTVGMAGDGPAGSGEELARRVYGYAVRMRGLGCPDTAAGDLGLPSGAVREAVDRLCEARLMRADAGGRRWVPVDPEVAAALLTTPVEREIHQRQERIALIRQRTSDYREAFAAGGAPGGEATGVEQVVGTLEVRGHLKLAADNCGSELLVLLSGRLDEDDVESLHQLCTAAAERGVPVRIVCQHRSRADLAVRTRIKQLAAAGAEVRTVSHVPRAAVVIDRSVALLLGPRDDAGEATASRVRAPGVVGFLLDVFDHLWDLAAPLQSFDPGYAEVAEDLQQTIAGLMAKGFTDEVLARKLGMSVRTCRRHIAVLMRELDAVSRFQAGVQAARRSLVVAG